jgi:hypothetical protein
MKNIYIIGLSFFLLTNHSLLSAKEIKLNSGTQQVNMVELFTSEGCSSCPPAEHWLNNLQKDSRLWKKIIPLAFHVDYWDDIGWKDRYASPANTQRQVQYKHQKGLPSVYTPGFLANGQEWRWRGLFGVRDIPLSTKVPGELSATINGNQVSAKFQPQDSTAKTWTLNVALLGFDLDTEIKAGENSGKILEHDFVVIGQKAQNSTNASWQLKLPLTEYPENRKAVVLWVNHVNQQAPLQAVGGWLK